MKEKYEKRNKIYFMAFYSPINYTNFNLPHEFIVRIPEIHK